MSKRKTPRPQNLSIYLGTEAVSTPRIAALDRMAVAFAGYTRDGKPNRSKFIAMIADGELVVNWPAADA